MNNTEKIVLRSIIKRLSEVSNAPWNPDIGGDIEDWADWAKRMKATILSINTILEDLSEEDSDEEKDKDPLNFNAN